MILLDILGIDISAWITGAGTVGVAGIIVTVLRKKGWISLVKLFSKKAAIISHQIGEAFIETSDVFEKMDEAIKENGHLKENCVKELIAEGKEALIEWNDVILIIKPKPKSIK